MLRYGSSVVTLPLVKLFNYILNNTDYPELWNVSLLSSIHKKVTKITVITTEALAYLAVSANYLQIFCKISL